MKRRRSGKRLWKLCWKGSTTDATSSPGTAVPGLCIFQVIPIVAKSGTIRKRLFPTNHERSNRERVAFGGSFPDAGREVSRVFSEPAAPAAFHDAAARHGAVHLQQTQSFRCRRTDR